MKKRKTLAALLAVSMLAGCTNTAETVTTTEAEVVTEATTTTEATAETTTTTTTTTTTVATTTTAAEIPQQSDFGIPDEWRSENLDFFQDPELELARKYWDETLDNLSIEIPAAVKISEENKEKLINSLKPLCLKQLLYWGAGEFFPGTRDYSSKVKTLDKGSYFHFNYYAVPADSGITNEDEAFNYLREAFTENYATDDEIRKSLFEGEFPTLAFIDGVFCYGIEDAPPGYSYDAIMFNTAHIIDYSDTKATIVILYRSIHEYAIWNIREYTLMRESADMPWRIDDMKYLWSWDMNRIYQTESIATTTEATTTTTESTSVNNEKLINKDSENEQFRYDEYENHIEIVDCLINEAEVSVPEKINDKPVTVIKRSSFSGCSKMENISLPNSITIIEGNAFNGCYKLKNITIPDGVRIINDNTFNYCFDISSITIPDGVVSIEDWAFSTDALTSVTIPDSVVKIGKFAFFGCDNLKSITYKGKEYSSFDEFYNLCFADEASAEITEETTVTTEQPVEDPEETTVTTEQPVEDPEETTVTTEQPVEDPEETSTELSNKTIPAEWRSDNLFDREVYGDTCMDYWDSTLDGMGIEIPAAVEISAENKEKLISELEALWRKQLLYWSDGVYFPDKISDPVKVKTLNEDSIFAFDYYAAPADSGITNEDEAFAYLREAFTENYATDDEIRESLFGGDYPTLAVIDGVLCYGIEDGPRGTPNGNLMIKTAHITEYSDTEATILLLTENPHVVEIDGVREYRLTREAVDKPWQIDVSRDFWTR